MRRRADAYLRRGHRSGGPHREDGDILLLRTALLPMLSAEVGAVYDPLGWRPMFEWKYRQACPRGSLLGHVDGSSALLVSLNRQPGVVRLMDKVNFVACRKVVSVVPWQTRCNLAGAVEVPFRENRYAAIQKRGGLAQRPRVERRTGAWRVIRSFKEMELSHLLHRRSRIRAEKGKVPEPPGAPRPRRHAAAQPLFAPRDAAPALRRPYAF